MLGTNLGRGVAWQIKALKITAQHSAAIFMYIVDTRGNSVQQVLDIIIIIIFI